MRLIQTGLSCNNRCVFCAQAGWNPDVPASCGVIEKAGQAGLEGEGFRRGLIEEAVLAVKEDAEIVFVGGEPTLHEDLTQAIKAARKAGARKILVQTNARRLCYLSYAKALAETGLDGLDVSLQGTTAAMHDYHTQLPGSWAQTVLGIKQAREFGVPIGISTVVTRSNFRHLKEIAALALKLGARALHFEMAKSYGRAGELRDQVVPAPEMAHPEIIAACRWAVARELPIFVFGRALPSDAENLFAGIGLYHAGKRDSPLKPLKKGTGTDATPFSKASVHAFARNAVPFSRRPNPGIGERRGSPKTGEELKKLFPELFSGAV